MVSFETGVEYEFLVPEALNLFATIGAAFKALVNWRKRARGNARAPEIPVECADAKCY